MSPIGTSPNMPPHYTHQSCFRTRKSDVNITPDVHFHFLIDNSLNRKHIHTNVFSFKYLKFLKGIFVNLITSIKLTTVVEGDQKAPFSITTTPRCREGRYLFSLDCSTLPLIRTLYCWVLSKEVSSIIFKVFGMTRPAIEPGSSRPLANKHSHH